MTSRFLTCAALLLVAPRADAYFHGHHGRGKPAPVQMRLELGVAEPHLADSRFTAQPTINGQRVGNVSILGKDFGAQHPKLADVSMHITGITHHVTLGGTFGVLVGGARGPMPAYPQDPVYGPRFPIAPDSTLVGYYTAAEFGTAFSWSAFDLAMNVAVGYRSIAVPLEGFDTVACGRGGTSRCQPEATDAGLFIRPKIALGIHHGEWGMGGYVALDVLPEMGWGAGAYFEASGDPWRQRASTRPAALPDPALESAY